MMGGEAQAATRSDDYRRRTPFVSSLVLQPRKSIPLSEPRILSSITLSFPALIHDWSSLDPKLPRPPTIARFDQSLPPTSTAHCPISPGLLPAEILVLAFLAAGGRLADAHLQALFQIRRLEAWCRRYFIKLVHTSTPPAPPERALDGARELGAPRSEGRDHLPRRPPERLPHRPLPLLGNEEKHGTRD